MSDLCRQGEIEKIAEEVENCRKCSLWKTRRNAVPGEGNSNSAVVFVGEAPGRREDIEGRPFVGAAGKILDETLEAISLPRDTVYITNVLKCRPPRNRDPRSAEVEACAPYLDRLLEVIRPLFVVTLGRHSTTFILSRTGANINSISEVRGQIFEANLWGSNVYVLPTFHPAAALYNVQLREYLEKDFGLLNSQLKRLGDSGRRIPSRSC
jgi:uracil-DNA glycosylase family 4